MDPTLQTLKSALESIRDLAANALDQNFAITGATFDAMEMQGLPVSQAFYEGGSVGSRWQMPAMQKHGV